MKALVTGGAGFIGTNLIKRLLTDGHEVGSVDNYSTGKKENHQDGCTYHDFDLSSSHTLGIYVDHGSYPSWRDEDYDVIFHLSAMARIQPSFKDPYKTIFNNYVSTLNILEYGRKNDIKVVYAGSSSVHGGVYKNPYTFTKWQGDKLCHMYSEVFNFPVNVCRFYNVYGPHQLTEGEYCTVVGIFETQYKNGEPLTITWDGEQRRDFTHVDDIVEGLVLTSESSSWGLTLELGRGKNHSINDLVDMFGDDYPREYIDKRPGEMRSTLCDLGLAFSAVGYSPTRELKDYVEEIKNG
jgi:UDP-glucose 4-epimerase|tara:strand:- start:145 stop:1029 length:885 start_codon:yes stop_codon:yes gene_type:complete